MNKEIEESKIENKLNNLMDELIDNVINTPDEEILKEVEKDYGDKAFLANKVKNILKKAKAKIEKELKK